jgi:4-amino-4-deoxy-L-arabinose transferase-like glycosyltransferase
MGGSTHPFTWKKVYIAMLLCVLGLLPFLDRPFSIDDPLFVWAAQHIAEDPLDPFGFYLNWKGSSQPMYQVSQNPVLGSYLLVPFGALFGWSELGLHVGGLIWALFLVVGIYALACRMTRRPLVATLATLLTPVVMISSTTVMCDVPMLTFWVWALVLWRRGLDDERTASLMWAGLLAGLAVLTKYSALGIVPLLLVDGLMRRRRPGMWLVTLAIPLAMFGLHELWTADLYGKGHFAMTRGVQAETPSQATVAQILTALTFTGAGVASVLWLAPVALSRGRALLWAGVTVVFTLGAVLARGPLQEVLGMSTELTALLAAQVGLWLGVGVGVLALAVGGVVSPSQAVAREGAGLTTRSDGVLLALWIGGVLVTAAFVKWWVDGRGILPLAPAVGILLARAIDRRSDAGVRTRPLVTAGLVASALLAVLVSWSELALARSNKAAAKTIAELYEDRPGELWFQGHWGFQYYLERAGGKAWSFSVPRLAVGDLVIMPRNNSFVLSVPADVTVKKEILTFPVPGWMTTMNPGAAGFHASSWGPVPFAFGPVPWPEEYMVAEATKSFGF